MKNLVLTLTFAAALVGCASNQNPMDPMTNGVKKKKSSIVETQACVVLAGRFHADDSRLLSNIDLATKNEGDNTLYSFNGSRDFIVADGASRKIKDSENKAATISASCDTSSVTLKVKRQDKEEETIKYILVDDKHVKVEGKGEEGSALAGTYTKVEEETPTPVPAPEPQPIPVLGNCPVINGDYVKTEGGETTLTIATKVEGPITSYSFDGSENSFVPADGSATPSGKLTCANGVLTREESSEMNDTSIATYTLLSETQLKVEANGVLSLFNGLYTKK